MQNLIKLYKKVGGLEILRQYRKAGVLGFALLQLLLLGTSKKSLEIIRLAVQNKVQKKLKKKYYYVIDNFTKNYSQLPQESSRKVWVCWLQGIENAPIVVQRCYDSLNKYLKNREIILITKENYADYVSFPQHIINKYNNGSITHTHFSDLLRLELLINYGGTWIDSTVLCTGGEIPDYMLDSELFLYQILKPGKDGHCINISSWFITASTNNKILLLVRDLLYEYWKSNSTLIEYYLFHTFFNIACEVYPDDWNKVIKFSNSIPHILLLSLFEKFDQNKYKIIKQMTCFHKLSYKHSDEQISKANTYYDFIINKGKY